MPERAEVAGHRKTFLITYVIATAACLLWLGGIWLAPYLKSQSSPWSSLVYAVYSPVCHQVASRSWFCFGYPLAVCARCTGIYLGFLLGLVCYPLQRGWRRISFPSSRNFILVSAPIVLDTVGNFLKLWHTPNAFRLATGVIWGALLPFYLIPGVTDLLIGQQKKRLNSPSTCP